LELIKKEKRILLVFIEQVSEFVTLSAERNLLYLIKNDKDCFQNFNRLNSKLNPIHHLLALLESHHILYVSRIRVNTGRRGAD